MVSKNKEKNPPKATGKSVDPSPKLAKPNSQNQLFSVEEAAEFLHCTPKSVKNWIHDGKIPAVQIGRRWLVVLSLHDLVKRAKETQQKMAEEFEKKNVKQITKQEKMRPENRVVTLREAIPNSLENIDKRIERLAELAELEQNTITEAKEAGTRADVGFLSGQRRAANHGLYLNRANLKKYRAELTTILTENPELKAPGDDGLLSDEPAPPKRKYKKRKPTTKKKLKEGKI